MTLILVYTLSKTILGHSFFNYILVSGVFYYSKLGNRTYLQTILTLNQLGYTVQWYAMNLYYNHVTTLSICCQTTLHGCHNFVTAL